MQMLCVQITFSTSASVPFFGTAPVAAVAFAFDVFSLIRFSNCSNSS